MENCGDNELEPCLWYQCQVQTLLDPTSSKLPGEQRKLNVGIGLPVTHLC